MLTAENGRRMTSSYVMFCLCFLFHYKKDNHSEKIKMIHGNQVMYLDYKMNEWIIE
jgi:hypothetical protein